MMKLGTMSLNVRNTTATAFAQTVYDLGFDVIELHSSAFESTDADYLRNLKMDLMRKGLPLGYIGVSNNFGRPVAEHPEQIALIKQWIDVAAFMSCPIVRVFAAYVPEDCDDEETLWPPMIEAFKEVAEYGYESGILVGLQNHNHNNVTPRRGRCTACLERNRSSLFSHISWIPDSTPDLLARVDIVDPHIQAMTATQASNKQPRTLSTSAPSFMK